MLPGLARLASAHTHRGPYTTHECFIDVNIYIHDTSAATALRVEHSVPGRDLSYAKHLIPTFFQMYRWMCNMWAVRAQDRCYVDKTLQQHTVPIWLGGLSGALPNVHTPVWMSFLLGGVG